VQHIVKHVLNLPSTPAEDAADALAVALCHAQTMRTATSIGGQLRYSKGRLKQVAKTNTVLES